MKYLLIPLILLSTLCAKGQNQQVTEDRMGLLSSSKNIRVFHKQFIKISTILSDELEVKLNETLFQDMFLEGLISSSIMLEKVLGKRGWNKDTLQSYFSEVYGSLIEENIADDHFPSLKGNYNRIRKNRILLKDFSGKWFGRWRNSNVNHTWLSPVKLNKTISIDSLSFSVKAYQSAFTGDGLGWNYLIEQDHELYLLGMTYHYQAGEITMRRPHVGLSQSEDTIVWLTKDHTYYEYTCQCDNIGLPEHYLIDGVYFYEDSERVEKAEGFRAIYSRGNVYRSDFSSFQVDLTKLNQTHKYN